VRQIDPIHDARQPNVCEDQCNVLSTDCLRGPNSLREPERRFFVTVGHFFVATATADVNIPYIIGRVAMMGKADRLPPTNAQEFRPCSSGNCWTATHSIRKK
jgi:hypothetical protein